MPDATAYEVRCPRCDTSFAPETRQCVHCGGPLGGGILVRMRQAAMEAEGGEHGGLPPGAMPPEMESQDEVMPSRGRNLLWIITAIVALVGSMMRDCQG